MSVPLLLTEKTLRREVMLNLQQLLSVNDVNVIMRSYLYQSCLLQSARGALFVVNPKLSTQPGEVQGDLTVQSVGSMETELARNGVIESASSELGWDELKSIARRLGWTQTSPRFSTSFGKPGTDDYCSMFGFVIRSNFGDVLGFVIFVSDQLDVFEIADRNVTAITEFTLYRVLEAFGIKQCVFSTENDKVVIRETAGRVFPALDTLYSRSVHDLRGVIATVAMRSQLFAADPDGSQKTREGLVNVREILSRAEDFVSITDAITRIFTGEISAMWFSELVEVSRVTGTGAFGLQGRMNLNVQEGKLPDSQAGKMLLFWLFHNLVRMSEVVFLEKELGLTRTDELVEINVASLDEQIVVDLKIPLFSTLENNNKLVEDQKPFQLGRRIRPPRKLIEQLLIITGGSLTFEQNRDFFFYKMVVPKFLL